MMVSESLSFGARHDSTPALMNARLNDINNRYQLQEECVINASELTFQGRF